MCKRPLSNNDFYPTFNRPNVTLIDVSETKGLEAMTEKGFLAGGREYEIDCMIFASGFEVTSIAALAADPAIMKRSGGEFVTAELAQEYGLTDVDGTVIPSARATRGSPIWKPISEVSYRGK